MTTTEKFDSAYLVDNPPARRQYRDRDEQVRAVNVVHTAESGTDLEGADAKAENVANFIRNRSDAGSYHLLGDTDSALLLVPLEKAAYGDGTGSNDWAVQISLAMNAGDWPKLDIDRRNALVDSFVSMAIHRARWDLANGRIPPAAKRLTRAESRKPDASGFIAHGDRDPGRRSDPGKFFPWDYALAQYADELANLEQYPLPMTETESLTYELQQLLDELGYPVAIDGDPGPETLGTSLQALRTVHAAYAKGSHDLGVVLAAWQTASETVANYMGNR